MKKTLFWFRQDLRLSDNPGLHAALARGAVLAVYILNEKQAIGPTQDIKGCTIDAPRQDAKKAMIDATTQGVEPCVMDASMNFGMGAASRWWLHHSLSKLNQKLQGHLNVYQGHPESIIAQLIQKHEIDAVYWNRCYEPDRITEDARIKAALKQRHIECKSFNASLLFEPWTILKSDGTPYKVFTAFYQNGCLRAAEPRLPLVIPEKQSWILDCARSMEMPEESKAALLQDGVQVVAKEDGAAMSVIAERRAAVLALSLGQQCQALQIEDLKLLPDKDWYQSLEQHWCPGEEGAALQCQHFIEEGLRDYVLGRDIPGCASVSGLSPYLHFGEVSVHQLWHRVQGESANPEIATPQIEAFLRQLIWREFSYYWLYHFPELPHKNWRASFDHFPWQNNPSFLRSWQQGQTGYPIVDAGMRELWQTGYMHNRVRMIVASFLIKNLNVDWRAGAAWFWDCLVDADLANNSASWQWVAGSGLDAAPYFRIFNPVTQAQRFDPEGVYIKSFLPELALLPVPYLFEPWKAPTEVLKATGVRLGVDYPMPIVDLKESRQRALAAFASLKSSTVP